MIRSTDPSVPEGLWPGLWVVATPLGNLGDLAPRARRAIEGAAALLCEDTRSTLKLLQALGLGTAGRELIRMDEQRLRSEPSQVEALLERLESGESLAYVSDAGTPGVADPGAVLARACLARGIRVVPVAGPSAAAALASVAGFERGGYAFRGFFPRKEGERAAELSAALAAMGSTVGGASGIGASIWFESPERITAALAALTAFCQANPLSTAGARVVVAKELTKLFERVFQGTPEEAQLAVDAEILAQGARGEWCFGWEIPARSASGAGDSASDSSAAWRTALGCLLRQGISASTAAREVSQAFGEPKNRVYSEALVLAPQLARETAKKNDPGG